MFMRRSRAGPAAVRPVPIVPHLPGACIVPRRARPDAAFPAPCRAPRRGEAEKRRLLKQALGRAASSKRPAAAKGTARHNIRLRRASGGNAGAGGALQGKIHACDRRAALCLAVPACPFACACGAKAPFRTFQLHGTPCGLRRCGCASVRPGLCRTLVCIYRERPHAALFSCTARLAASTAAGAPSVRPDLCRTPVCIYRERPHAVCSAARHALRPAPLRVRCPFSRVHAALSYAFAGRTHYTRKTAQSPLPFSDGEQSGAR